MAEDLRRFESLTPVSILALAKAGIKTLDDLADLDSDELLEHLSPLGPISGEDAGEIIMEARAHWFDDEPETDTADEDAAVAEGAESLTDDHDASPERADASSSPTPRNDNVW